jgi:unsaturated chondroitin disaccharide hydrolase
MRFKEKGKYLRSFISDESLFIDIMMNVGVIFYAANQLGTRNSEPGIKLNKIACEHCATTIRTLIRGDGSTAHEGIFNTQTGEFLKHSTHQGFRGDSCWSRGLAWSLYGFGTCYQLTSNPVYFNSAEHHAGYYLNHTPTDGIPPWDYDNPADIRTQTPNSELGTRNFLPDSSTAAIATVGLLNLSKLTPDSIRSRAYREFALRTLDTLTRPPYLALNDRSWQGILKRGVYHIHKNLGVDESVMWGEFFFVEALVKALDYC